MLVQSHTPFAELVHGVDGKPGLKDKCIMVLGGDNGKCRDVAERYGFTNVITPGDIFAAYPEIWPFSKVFLDYYKSFTRPLPRPINQNDPDNSLKVDAIFVFNDPRDWGLDIQILLDVLLSRNGIVGTYSGKNNDRSLPNNGYQQDGQPPLYFSNTDLFWATGYHLSRLGQGGFGEAFEGVCIRSATDLPYRIHMSHQGSPGAPLQTSNAPSHRSAPADRPTRAAFFGGNDRTQLLRR